MSFNAPADFPKNMLWGLWPIMTCRMVLDRRANLAGSNLTSSNVASSNVSRSFVVGRYCKWLVLLVLALLVFMAPAGAQSLPEPLRAAYIIQYKRLI
jgi:hypothetical protein